MKTLALVLLSLCAVGCNGATPIELEDYPDELVVVTCRLMFECCEEGMRRGYTDAADCVADRIGLLDSVATEIQTSIDAGRVQYDAAAASECLTTMTCGDLGQPNRGPCGDIEIPLVPVGGACERAAECIEGDCVGSSTGPRTCELQPGVGEPCTGRSCADGARCDLSTGTCVQVAPLGASCDGDSACESYACEDGVCAESTGFFCGT